MHSFLFESTHNVTVVTGVRLSDLTSSYTVLGSPQGSQPSALLRRCYNMYVSSCISVFASLNDGSHKCTS